MMKVKNLLTGMLAVLAVLLLTGCGEKDNPSRTSLDVDTSTLTLSVGETAVRMAPTLPAILLWQRWISLVR